MVVEWLLLLLSLFHLTMNVVGSGIRDSGGAQYPLRIKT